MASVVEPKYAPLTEAAAWAGLSVRSLQRLVRDGRLTAHTFGSRRLVELAELDAVIRGDQRPDGCDARHDPADRDQAASARPDRPGGN